MSQAHRVRPKTGEHTTPGSGRKKGRLSGKELPDMGSKKRNSVGKRSSNIARECCTRCDAARPNVILQPGTDANFH
jgi:hypothetical protein